MSQTFKNSPIISDILSRLTSVESTQGAIPTPTEYDTIADLRAETTYQNENRALVSVEAAIFVFDSSSSEEDNGETILKPDDIQAATPGRWIREIRLSIVGHTHEDKADKITGPAKDKFLVSDEDGNPQEHTTGPGNYAASDHNHDDKYAAKDHNHNGEYATPGELNSKMNKLSNVTTAEVGAIPFIREDGHLDKSTILASNIPTANEKAGIAGLTGEDPAVRASQLISVKDMIRSKSGAACDGTAGQRISFSSGFVGDYVLTITDRDGVGIGIESQDKDGFVITSLGAGSFDYIAVVEQ